MNWKYNDVTIYIGIHMFSPRRKFLLFADEIMTYYFVLPRWTFCWGRTRVSFQNDPFFGNFKIMPTICCTIPTWDVVDNLSPNKNTFTPNHLWIVLLSLIPFFRCALSVCNNRRVSSPPPSRREFVLRWGPTTFRARCQIIYQRSEASHWSASYSLVNSTFRWVLTF